MKKFISRDELLHKLAEEIKRNNEAGYAMIDHDFVTLVEDSDVIELDNSDEDDNVEKVVQNPKDWKAKENEIEKKTRGERIEYMLERRKMSKAELAELSGLTDRTIRYYIRDERVPRANTLAKIAKALDTTMDYLEIGIVSRRDKR